MALNDTISKNKVFLKHSYILLILFLGCTQKNCSEYKEIQAIQFRLGAIVDTTDYHLHQSHFNSRTEWIYLFDRDKDGFNMDFGITSFPNKAYIIFNTDTAELKGKGLIGDIEIKEYYYDNQAMADEELNIFFSHEFGLIYIEEEAWDARILFYHSESDISKEEYKNIFENINRGMIINDSISKK